MQGEEDPQPSTLSLLLLLPSCLCQAEGEAGLPRISFPLLLLLWAALHLLQDPG